MAFLSRCECGTERVVLAQAFRDGTSLSCGCAARRLLVKVNTTHGMSKTPEFRIWTAAQQRCMNPKSRAYRHYGGRGVRFYEGWLGPDGFSAFIAHVGPRPSSVHELDRIDVNGHYEPGNVRWATRREQCRNTRRNRLVEYDGRSWCVAALAEHIGVNRNTLIKRLNSGFSIDRVVAPVSASKTVGA